MPLWDLIEPATESAAVAGVQPDSAAPCTPRDEEILGWTAPPTLRLSAWAAQGEAIVIRSRAPRWALGDWLCYGTRILGVRYSAASGVTGYSVQTLRNFAYVASRIPRARRNPNVSWSHHAMLAPLSDECQEAWLARLELEPLPWRAVRRMLDDAALRADHSTGRGRGGARGAGHPAPSPRAARATPGEHPTDFAADTFAAPHRD